MTLNNYFNWKRFTLLLKQDLLINKSKYFFGIIGLGLITYLLTYWLLYSNKIKLSSSYDDYYVTSFVIFMIVVGVFISTAFPDLKDKIKTTNYLLTPGSTLEKYLVQFVLRIGLFIPIALGIFWISVRLAKASLLPELLYDNSYFDPKLVPYFEFRILVSSSMGHLWKTWQILLLIFGILSIGSCLFAGSVIFKRNALIKTLIFLSVLLGCSILFSMILSNIFYNQDSFFEINLKDFQITENLTSQMLFTFALSMLSWIFALLMAYFKLKEKEV